MKERTCFILAFLFCFLVGMAFAISVSAKEVTTKLGWSADAQPSPNNTLPWDKIFIYARQGSGVYDYTKPAATVAQTYVNGKSQPIIVSIKSIVPDQAKTTLYFVARAGNGELRSPDSVEVSRVADTTTLNPVNTFIATYNRQTKAVDMAWSNENIRVKEWVVFVKDTPDGAWTEFYRVKRTTQGATVTASKAIDVSGLEVTKYFTVISYSDFGDVFSVDSMEARVIIDLKSPAIPADFKVHED